MDHPGLGTAAHGVSNRKGAPAGASEGAGLTCERELRALNMSNRTKQVKVMVVSRGVITLSCNWNRNRKSARERVCGGAPSGAAHLSPEDEQSPADDDHGRHQDLRDEAARDDAVFDVAGGFPDHVTVHRLHPQTANRFMGLERVQLVSLPATANNLSVHEEFQNKSTLEKGGRGRLCCHGDMFHTH